MLKLCYKNKRKKKKKNNIFKKVTKGNEGSIMLGDIAINEI